MAKNSLVDLHSFLNRYFWRIELLFEKASCLRIFCAAGCCLSVLRPEQAKKEPTVLNRGEEKSYHPWLVLVHALTRHATELPGLCWRVGGVVLST